MKHRILLFGVAKDIIGAAEYIADQTFRNVGELRAQLYSQYPALQRLNSLMVAVNKSYAADDVLLDETDEIALIPPVSGG